MTLKRLSTKILNAVKVYLKRVSDLQDEVIKFDEEIEKQMWGDKK